MWRPPALFLPWCGFAALCCLLMALSPGEETIPLHLGWISLCVSYGFALWPPTVTVLSITGYALASGAVLTMRAADGVLGWQETAEIPLMSVMALVMAWHVHRRVQSMRHVRALADAEKARHEERERVSRMYSHEMRTPLTIARGYLSLLQAERLTSDQHEDLNVIDDELGTLERVGDRLVRMLAVTDYQHPEPIDVDELLDEVGRRWGTVATRRWVVDASAGHLTCSRERLRMCLDTLVENALRYTDEDDTVRLFAYRADAEVVLGVADSGPGLAPDLLDGVNRRATGCDAEPLAEDARRQTGLGLELVRQVARSQGGAVRARVAPEGGAWVALVLPVGDRHPTAPIEEVTTPAG